VPLLPGIAAGGTAREFPVRGFAPDAAVGRTAAAGTVELRLPVALVGRGVGLVPGALDRLSLALFADGAAVWSRTALTTRHAWLPRQDARASLGVEAVADLGVVYDYPVRLRSGVARRLGPSGGALGYLAIGAAF